MATLYSIILAGGEGRRMAKLTQALFGRWVPKQFAPIGGERTLLQRTMDRSVLVAPAARTLVVVPAPLTAVAAEQLSDYIGVEIVGQPENRATGPGMLLPLSRVLARNPEAEVVVFPSDHQVERPGRLRDAVTLSLLAADRAEDGVAVVGATPEGPGRDLGWLLKGATVPQVPGASRVRQFLEKPPRAAAERLRELGGLWNTFILAGRAQALWELARRHLPRHVDAFEAAGMEGVASSPSVLQALYRSMPPADFSRSVLQKATGLCAVEMRGAGWADWGTPETVLASLRGTAGFDVLLARLMDLADPVEQRRWARLATGASAEF